MNSFEFIDARAFVVLADEAEPEVAVEAGDDEAT